MLIVSQDKKMLVNFNNIVSVYVIENYISEEKGVNGYNIDFATNEEINFILATYKTEEKAMRVLKEIRTTYFEENCEFENGMYHMQRTYEMPEDKED